MSVLRRCHEAIFSLIQLIWIWIWIEYSFFPEIRPFYLKFRNGIFWTKNLGSSKPQKEDFVSVLEFSHLTLCLIVYFHMHYSQNRIQDYTLDSIYNILFGFHEKENCIENHFIYYQACFVVNFSRKLQYISHKFVKINKNYPPKNKKQNRFFKQCTTKVFGEIAPILTHHIRVRSP